MKLAIQGMCESTMSFHQHLLKFLCNAIGLCGATVTGLYLRGNQTLYSQIYIHTVPSLKVQKYHLVLQTCDTTVVQDSMHHNIIIAYVQTLSTRSSSILQLFVKQLDAVFMLHVRMLKKFLICKKVKPFHLKNQQQCSQLAIQSVAILTSTCTQLHNSRACILY